MNLERPFGLVNRVLRTLSRVQVLEADGSCQKAVSGWAAQRAADGLSACSVRTGGYCRARQRLPLEMVSALTRQTGQLLSQKALSQWRWRGWSW